MATNSSRPRAKRRPYGTGIPDLDARLMELVDEIKAVDPQLTYEMLVTAVRVADAPLGRLDRKMINVALKEMRYAFGVFARYRNRRKVTTFGSARVDPGDREYALAVEFGRIAAERGWMVVTGAGPGIMEAVNKGAGKESSFGVNIVLPFENKPNPFVASDPKLMNFRYFFTRKLMFIKEADAFALFPGGFGTLDELFELLTLVQTGKSDVHPIVMLEAPGGSYWQEMDTALRRLLRERGYVDEEDLHLYHLTDDPTEAVDHINRFFRVYHSQRYVGELLILRLSSMPTEEEVEALNREFADILRSPIVPTRTTAPELRDDDVVDLPRLAVPFDRTHFARLRVLIDRINSFGTA
jgi:uncharacterized protein (TIGR00730 family)